MLVSLQREIRGKNVMTAVDIRAAINNDPNTFSMDMLHVVADYVRLLRKKRDEENLLITPLVASLFLTPQKFIQQQ